MATLANGINPLELTKETYIEYCRLYLTDKIHAIVPIGSLLEYRHVSRIIKLIDSNLFLNLNTETGKLILLNKIYSLFMEAGNHQLSREFLHKLLDELDLSEYNKSLYGKSEVENLLDEIINHKSNQN